MARAGFDDYIRERPHQRSQPRAYCPSVAEDPTAGATSRAISRRLNATDKFVVSDTLGLTDTGRWRVITEVVPRADAYALMLRASVQGAFRAGDVDGRSFSS